MIDTGSIGNLSLSQMQQMPTVQKVAEYANPSFSIGNGATDKSSHLSNDQTSISTASTVLAQALTTSDVRMEKVASLQQAISSGSYNVSSADVAGKMLHSLLE